VDGRISTQLVVDDAGLTGAHHLTVLALSWTDADPLAVTICLSPRPDHPSLPRGEWVALRDFLRYGCSEPTGDGEVRIRPDGPHQVLLELHHDGRPYQVHVPVAALLAFLDETEEVVPTGREAGEAVLDELIRRLLDR
jgi:hypothetical protein